MDISAVFTNIFFFPELRRQNLILVFTSGSVDTRERGEENVLQDSHSQRQQLSFHSIWRLALPETLHGTVLIRTESGAPYYYQRSDDDFLIEGLKKVYPTSVMDKNKNVGYGGIP